LKFVSQLEKSIQLIETLKDNKELIQAIEESIDLIISKVNLEQPLLVCGNGGSASDAEHITGELVGRFLKERKAINAICLSSNSSTITAWANDYDYESIFSRQMEAHAKKGGVLLAITTSGNSKNILHAADTAKIMNIPLIGLTGSTGGKLKERCDLLINVPSNETPRIQELHKMVYHYICEEIEIRYNQ
jgi:D-sedoheptulose 7-phosphate isomerase